MPKVVILLSDKRSGSTFLERELCRHKEVAHVDYTSHTYNETHYWLKAALLLKMPSIMFHGTRSPGSYGSYKQIRASLIKNIKGNIPDFTPPEDDLELVFSGWEAICRNYAQPVFFEKSPHHPLHWAALELILRWRDTTDFEVKFIALVRNPMAVLCSAQKLFHTPPDKRQYTWMAVYQNLLILERYLQPNQILWVKYEDMTSNPEVVFSTICNFIGIECDAGMGKSATNGSLSHWKHDPDFQLTLDPSVRRLARIFDYADVDLDCERSSNSSRPSNIKSELIRLSKIGRSRLYYLVQRFKG